MAEGVPTAVLSRGLAGLAGRTLIVNLPGSRGGARDGMAVSVHCWRTRSPSCGGGHRLDGHRRRTRRTMMGSPVASSTEIVGRGGFGTDHRWPVTLRYRDIELAPMRTRHQADWEQVRRENLNWLRPWEATLPPGAQPGPSSLPGAGPPAGPPSQGRSAAAVADLPF